MVLRGSMCSNIHDTTSQGCNSMAAHNASGDGRQTVVNNRNVCLRALPRVCRTAMHVQLLPSMVLGLDTAVSRKRRWLVASWMEEKRFYQSNKTHTACSL